MNIFISESESYHNHIICISYSYHIIPKLKLLADMFFQKYPKPPKSSVPKPTWSQRAVANQSLGPRTAMISHLQHGPQLQTRKIRQSETRTCWLLHTLWILSFFVLGKHQFLCLNTWNLAISFWSITKLEFIILFDQSVFWPNLAWRIIFQRKRKERRGNRKGWRKGLERNRKGTKRNKKEKKRKDRTAKAKQKARNLPNTKPNTDDFLDPKRVGDWGGLKSHYILYYKPPCQVSPSWWNIAMDTTCVFLGGGSSLPLEDAGWVWDTIQITRSMWCVP